MIVVGDSQLTLRVSQLAKCAFNALDVSFCRVEHGEFFGGAIFNGFTGVGGSIGVHVGCVRTDWMTRDMIWMCFDYPFNQLYVNKLIGKVAASNKEAINYNLRMGFTEETRIKDAFPDGDLIVMSMYKADCRWLALKPKHVSSGGGNSHG